VNPNNIKSIQLRGLGLWLITLLLLFGLGSILPDWFIELSTVLLGLVIVAPVIGFFGLRWWLTRKIVTGSCPVCAAPLSAFQNTELQCQNCGEELTVKDRKFVRPTPPGTVDVEVISSQAIDD
jgi:hypothetical protein